MFKKRRGKRLAWVSSYSVSDDTTHRGRVWRVWRNLRSPRQADTEPRHPHQPKRTIPSFRCVGRGAVGAVSIHRRRP